MAFEAQDNDQERTEQADYDRLTEAILTKVAQSQGSTSISAVK